MASEAAGTSVVIIDAVVVLAAPDGLTGVTTALTDRLCALVVKPIITLGSDIFQIR